MRNKNVDFEKWMDTTPFDGEVWKDVVGYEDLYQISNIGRLKAKKRIVYRGNRWGNNSDILKEEHILVPNITKYGYVRSVLTKDKKHKSYAIHRLVAEAFISNPENLPFVNHKDENKSNNKVENLEWCTAKYNSNYGTCIDRIREKNTGKGHVVFQYDKDGKFMARFSNAYEALRCLGKYHNGIQDACKTGNLCYGFQWRKEKDGYKKGKDISPFVNKRFVPIAQFDKNGNKIGTFKSIAEASRETNIPESSIHNAWRKGHYAYGYKFAMITK